MNAAGKAFEFAVWYANLWDRIYRVSGKVGGFVVGLTVVYVVASILWH